jgi:hypothetical protein
MVIMVFKPTYNWGAHPVLYVIFWISRFALLYRVHLSASQDAQDALAGTGPARCSMAPLDTILLLLPVSGQRIHGQVNWRCRK